MKLSGKTVVWPAYIDSTKSRREGRKLSKGLSVQIPRLDELSEAARRLSLQAEVVHGKSRPNAWWEKGGYLILPKKNPKTDLARSLANEIRKIRTAKAGQEKEHKQ